MTAPTEQERAFAAEVDRARGAARVTQDWLARRIELSRGKVSEICSGRYVPAYETVLRLIEALGMDRERTLRLWRDAQVARDARKEGERLARNAPDPVGWERLPVLPAEIASLMYAQVVSAERLPYRLRGAKPLSLSTVYVRQDLGQPIDDMPAEVRLADQRPEEERGHRHGEDGAPESRSRLAPDYQPRQQAPSSRAIRPPAKPVRVALDEGSHLLITGGPGQGKSTLTLRLSADVAKIWLEGGGAEAPLSEPVVPLRLPARELAAHVDMPLPEALAKSVATEFGPLLRSEVPARMLAERVQGCRWLLLIDALDEIVEREAQERLLQGLAGWASEHADSPYRVLVTSRPLGSGGLAALHRVGAARYELQPFDAEALQHFAEQWFGADGAADGELLSRRFLLQVKKAHLDELMRVPLLATIAAIIFEQHRDRPLPDNRYDLYETYLTYLAEGGRSRNRLDHALRDVRGPLLEHLGETRLRSTASLLGAAWTWVAAHVPSERLALDWRSDVVGYLTGVGPMIARKDDLEFIHHSFADHLAATAEAQKLPTPFDAEAHAWKEVLHGARNGFAAEHAEAVLVHYCHLQAGDTDEVVRWLHDNTSGFQLVAAKLIAQHVPAGAATVDGFLITARRWAQSSHYSGVKILEAVSQAAHHPSLASWLESLMVDQGVAWGLRIDAASALCTLFEVDDRSSALALLHDVLGGSEHSSDDRIAAAEALADLGVEHRAAAADGLRVILSDTVASNGRLRAIAVALSDLGPEARAEAVRCLRSVLEDPATRLSDLGDAAVSLAEIAPEFEALAAGKLMFVISETMGTAIGAYSAIWSIGRLGPQYVAEAAHLLIRFSEDVCKSLSVRVSSLEQLAGLGPEFAAIAAQRICDLLERPETQVSDRPRLTSALASLGPMYRDLAAGQLLASLDDPMMYVGERQNSADILVRLGVDFHNRAAEEYMRIWSDVLAVHGTRCRALASLAELGPGCRADAVRLLLDTITDSATDASLRVAAASQLIGLDVEVHPTVETVLRHVMSDESAPAQARLDAASGCHQLSSRFRDDVASVLVAVAADCSADGSARYGAAMRLVELGPRYNRQSEAMLREVLDHAFLSGSERVSAISKLLTIDPSKRAEVLDSLCDIVRSDRAEHSDRIGAVNRMAEIGFDSRLRAEEEIRAKLLISGEDPSMRRSCAVLLASLGESCRSEAAEILSSLLADPNIGDDLRVDACVALAELGVDHRDVVILEFRALLMTMSVSSRWRDIASRLAAFGSDSRTAAIDVLRGSMMDPDIGGGRRRDAAQALAAIAQEHRIESVSAMHRFVAEFDHDPERRAYIARDVVALSAPSWGDMRSRLFEMMSDPGGSVSGRCAAAGTIVEVDRDYWSKAAAMLRSVPLIPHSTLADHCAALTGLRRIRAITDSEQSLGVLAIAYDPAAGPAERLSALYQVRGMISEHTSLMADLLGDRSLPLWARIPYAADFFGAAAPMLANVEAVFDEVLTGREYDAGEKTRVAKELELLRGEYRRKAVDAYRSTANSCASPPQAVIAALDSLAAVDDRYAVEARVEADRLLDRDGWSARHRVAAASIGLDREGRRPKAEEVLRSLLLEGAPNIRVKAATSLVDLGPMNRSQAVGELKRLIQSGEANDWVRNEAACLLARWSHSDRAAAAAVTDEIAASPSTRPPLRWRAAEALAKSHGARHRPAAVAYLLAFMDDETMGTSARIGAAEAVVGIDPRHLRAALRVLREIGGNAEVRAAARTDAFETMARLGRRQVDEAVAGLRKLVHSPSLTLPERGRAAAVMARLHRHTRDEASVVLRDVIRATHLPPQIRWRAAQALARISLTCRDEALECLETLANAPWG